MSLAFERNLRSKPFERPKPLRRGHGVGGGNYAKLGGDCPPSRGTAVPPKPPACARPGSSGSKTSTKTSVSSAPCVPSTSKENVCPPKTTVSRPRSSSASRPLSRPLDGQGRQETDNRSCNRPTTSSSKGTDCDPGPSTSRPLTCKVADSRPSTSRAPDSPQPSTSTGGPTTSGRSVCSPGPSKVKTPAKSKSAPRPSGSSSRGTATPRKAPLSTSKRAPDVSFRPSESNASSRTTSARSSSAPGARGKSTCKPSSAGPSRTRARASNARRGPPQPGPSCLRPPPNDGRSRNVKFSGVPSPGPGLSPDTRWKYMPKKTYFGPSVYPIYPDQYEQPFRSLPGPKQVILMPGDINPNETTIIDIIGISEGDLRQVPCVPPHAPASLLEDARKAEAEELAKARALAEAKAQAEAKAKGRVIRKKPSVPRQRRVLKKDPMDVGEGKPFSFEKFGNITFKDRFNPKRGATNGTDRHDPECERARGFNLRKTIARPLTDEEREAIQQAQAYKAIKCILEETDARILCDRESRGLGDNDLIDIDAEVSTPPRVRRAPKDIFRQTDKCRFPAVASQLPPVEISPPCSSEDSGEIDLMAWGDEEGAPYQQGCYQDDILTGSPNNYSRRGPSTSPRLMEYDEPDVDFLGFNSPATTCRPEYDEDDLMQWDSPLGGALPFDEGFQDENLFDAVTMNSPMRALLQTPPMNFTGGMGMNQGGVMMVCHPINSQPASSTPCKREAEPRVVRAIPLEDDPTTVVLEGSPLAKRSLAKSYPQEDENMCDDDDSLGLLDDAGDDEPWLCDENFVENFNKPFQRRSVSMEPQCNYNDISGVQKLDECQDDEEEDDELGILGDDYCSDGFNFDQEVDQRFRDDARVQSTFYPLSGGQTELLADQRCAYDPSLEYIDQRIEAERADLLQLHHDPDCSMMTRGGEFGRLGSELINECGGPIEEFDDVFNLCKPGSNMQRTRGPYTQELLDNCPDEQELLDIGDECPSTPSPPPPTFGYSRDLFTNVEWDPAMTPMKPDDSSC